MDERGGLIMFDLDKLKDNNAIFWIFRFPEYRKIAAECGWAIAIHGSAVHDLDLMAMPWVENHTSADELAQRLTDTEQPNFRRPYEKSKPGDKPNGRIVYTIFTGGTYIDMNVIETPDKNAIVESVIEWLHGHTAMSEFEYELMRKDLEE
jgi:peptidoglycan/xylan/chitin deacetylase (PgdA/CDA1 family)